MKSKSFQQLTEPVILVFSVLSVRFFDTIELSGFLNKY